MLPGGTRASLEVIARGGALIMPVVMMIAGIVGPSLGPAVVGAVWLPLSLWFVIVRPLLRKRPRTVYKRPWEPVHQGGSRPSDGLEWGGPSSIGSVLLPVLALVAQEVARRCRRLLDLQGVYPLQL